ncbi:PREDICTED: Y+L amino acid transporter 2-like [Priapulus caudatus]|uniref:Y+L amino acid transporter 2-like n=1 Tax=Priapulus caudatus TaxID=37621 RepID=A0ABM1E869_PRICU|nr:PREDICTED: Y+L amino acid transporter 2-like [Priapulus caudatus]XP_014668384.1 PREDICTED: Y+L amino acid transporter 2-like [Priapulus caudatus]XP_014668385.1 PREDICTED: Y+L amino acid transporter 2-like [Priapulus caudatus]XP_014668386.1 PREDICTED: Y+L amino acid transporter 2-like [Priapulus caudatus]XP_014668387.1 PREDICTED: Y+L amino acid transporter 2-like [Priapulus caudatus]XP_014668388.1 PREDICTED: Y+L amino acid transporter 2-like [Priapulus caudatus]XP_014668389.1 PREDICTED: Y+L
MDQVRNLHWRREGYRPVETDVPELETSSPNLIHELKHVASEFRHKVEEVKQVVSLKRELGLVSAMSYVVGSIIGSGIFISPKGVLEHTGSSGFSLIVWSLCGLLALLGGLLYAELASTIPKSGGIYTYMNEFFGPLVAFVSLWSMFLGSPASNAVLAQTGATYVLQLFYGGCKPPGLSEQLLALLFIASVFYFNYIGVRSGATFQVVTTVGKVLALAVIICVGFFHLIKGETQNITMEGSRFNLGDLSLAFYIGMFAYSGWEVVVTAVEEIENPAKIVTQALIYGVLACVTVYILTNVAYYSVMSTQELLAAPAVAVLFGKKTMGVMHWIIPLFVSVSVIGGINSSVMSMSRYAYASSREGHMPRFLSLINVDKLTMKPAIFFSGLLSSLYVFVSGVYQLITYLQFLFWLNNLLLVSGVLWWRYKYPEKNRPVKFPIILHIILFVLSALLLVMPFWTQPKMCLYGLFLAAMSLPCYAVFIMESKCRPAAFKALDNFNEWLNMCMQLIFAATYEDEDVSNEMHTSMGTHPDEIHMEHLN